MRLYHEIDGEKFVRWTVFVWAVAVLTSLILFVGTIASGASASVATHNQQSNKDLLEIKTQLSQIQTDIIWLKQNLK